MKTTVFAFLIRHGLPGLIGLMLLFLMGMYLRHHGYLIPTYNQ